MPLIKQYHYYQRYCLGGRDGKPKSWNPDKVREGNKARYKQKHTPEQCEHR